MEETLSLPKFSLQKPNRHLQQSQWLLARPPDPTQTASNATTGWGHQDLP